MKRFNDWLGDRLAYGLSTMECFWLVSAFVLIPLIWQRPHDLVGWIQYIVQSFFQGSALPVLGYVSRIAGDKLERLILAIHEWTKVNNQMIREELAIAKEDNVLIKEELKLAREEREDMKRLLREIHHETKGSNCLGL